MERKLFSPSFQFNAPRCRLLPDVRACSKIRRNGETDVDLLVTKSAGRRRDQKIQWVLMNPREARQWWHTREAEAGR